MSGDQMAETRKDIKRFLGEATENAAEVSNRRRQEVHGPDISRTTGVPFMVACMQESLVHRVRMAASILPLQP